jgi:hypothetical protein
MCLFCRNPPVYNNYLDREPNRMMNQVCKQYSIKFIYSALLTENDTFYIFCLIFIVGDDDLQNDEGINI